ncbi:hypothetical protein HX794_02695 [Pseudomonas costantinii]|uniref:hypothetical protein n=1 Tax=Pseudomonas costantinii TaxID=168469 RepID=UPI0015A27A91|nr:hypothetical protein [Pseudomonas costantinii]NVZ18545.1 hypothetical protein [Pseudomonas costantinii]
MKLDKGATQQLTWGDHADFELIEEGEWTQDHKYQHCDFIVKHTETGKFYEFSISRSGSYHTDWYYSYEDEEADLTEVQKVTKTFTREVWQAV